MPFIYLSTVSSDIPVGARTITANDVWEAVKLALVRTWAFIVKIALAISMWAKETWTSVVERVRHSDLGEKIMSFFSMAVSTVDDFTRTHPLWTGIPLVLVFAPNLIRVLVFVPRLLSQLLLLVLGFNRRGVSRGSLAASYQSQHYTYGTGGIPEDSTFAYMQSAGARTPTWRTSLVMSIWYAVDLALGVWGFYILARYYQITA